MVSWVARKLSSSSAVMNRRQLSSSSPGNMKNYLDTMLGNPKPNKLSSVSPSYPKNAPPPPVGSGNRNRRNNNTNTTPLVLSGSSYLMPTLRLERNDTPESLSDRIATALDHSSAPNSAIVRSMLTGKETAATADDGSSSRMAVHQRCWRVPIVLDLAALVPDGSPHYIPPRHGLLSGTVHALDAFGIAVVAISNPPAEMEHEAVNELGLPAVMTKSRALDRTRDAKFCVEDVVQLVVRQQARDNEMTGTKVDEFEEIEKENSKEKVLSSEKRNATPLVEAFAEISSQEEHPGARGGGSAGIESVIGSNDDATRNKPESPEDDMIALQQQLSPAPQPIGETKIYRGSVRSGQQVSADKNQSLIIIGQVNSGGEVLADGDIYVFGKLRGRALAGLAASASNSSGDENTRIIFASSFDPELVCIGDSFTTVDNVGELGLAPGKAAMASLGANGELAFESVTL